MFFLKKSLPGAIYCQIRLQQLPTIPVDVSSYNILETPHRCFNRILELIASAKERILITALYLQDDEIGRQVLQALYDAKEKNPHHRCQWFYRQHGGRQSPRLGVRGVGRHPREQQQAIPSG